MIWIRILTFSLVVKDDKNPILLTFLLFTVWRLIYIHQSRKNRFFSKTFFGWTFYEGQIYIFEISIKRRIFGYRIRPIQRKKFYLIEESVCTLYELKRGLCFLSPFQNVMPDIWASKSLVPSVQGSAATPPCWTKSWTLWSGWERSRRPLAGQTA
jgi:hypothetical protein